VLVSKQ